MKKTIELNNFKEYTLQYDWPECLLQGNEYGIVGSKNGVRETAFFEAFPETFIRGEGKTVKEAETDAWNKYQKTINCSKHEFKRHSDDGSGICKKCNLFKRNVLPCIKRCSICNKDSVGFLDLGKEKNLCFEHYKDFLDNTVLDKDGVLNFEKYQEKLMEEKTNIDYTLYLICVEDKYKIELMEEKNLIESFENDYELSKYIREYWQIYGQYLNCYIYKAVDKISLINILRLRDKIVRDKTLYKNIANSFILCKKEIIESKSFKDEFFKSEEILSKLSFYHKEVLEKS